MAAVDAQSRSLADCAGPLLARVQPGERALAQELTYGTLRFLPRLARLARSLLAQPPRRRDADVFALACVGLYQLDQLGAAPHVAVDTSAEAARALDKPWAVGVINAVLRRFDRERDAVLKSLADQDEFRFAHPQWLIDALRRAWPRQWESILEAGNRRPPMTLRVNATRCDRDDYARRLQDAGLDCRPVPGTTHGLILRTPVPVERLPGFSAGEASVQDGAAQLAAPLLDPAAGLRILDACAAPGGKAAHLAEIAPGAGILAVDSDAGRLERAQAAFQRLGLSIRTQCTDASVPGALAADAPFDRILVDAPCSGTGVIRRHPDIKSLRRPSDIAAYAARQDCLLDALWPVLATGGKLLYVTCSVLPGENAERIAAFLDRHGDAALEPWAVPWGHDTGHGRQIFPGENDMDGFFLAALRRLGGRRA